jgi:hypothetical protein
MAATRRTSTRKLKGRSKVAIGLLAFIVVTSVVVWRRSLGVANAKAMQQALIDKRTLLSEVDALEGEIRNAQKRERVIVDAQRRLGLHVAPESQTRVLLPPGASQ